MDSVTLDFVASRTQDAILLTVGNGGAFRGKSWFAGIRIDAAGSDSEWPAREAVQTFGPAIGTRQRVGSICISRATLTCADTSTAT